MIAISSGSGCEFVPDKMRGRLGNSNQTRWMQIHRGCDTETCRLLHNIARIARNLFGPQEEKSYTVNRLTILISIGVSRFDYPCQEVFVRRITSLSSHSAITIVRNFAYFSKKYLTAKYEYFDVQEMR